MMSVNLIISMPDFVGAFSDFKQKVFDWGESKKYRGKKKYRVLRDYFVGNSKEYGKIYTKYFLFEFLPFVVAYGVIINVPLSVLLGMALNAATIVSWGLIFYMISSEFVPLLKELLKVIG